MSGGNLFAPSRQQGQGPTNLWSGYGQTQYQQPRGQMMQPGFMGGGGYQAWPGYGYGGMPGRYGGMTGYQSYGTWGMPFGGYSGGYNPYGPGSYSAPGAMPFGGGSGMYGGGSYNMMANQMAGIPYMQMARSRFSQPYQYVQPPTQQPPPGGGLSGLAGQGMQTGNPMNPASGCYYDSSQDDFICPGR